MRNTLTLPVKVFEEMLELPEGVYVGSIQYNTSTNCVDVGLIDEYNKLPEKAILESGKGWRECS